MGELNHILRDLSNSKSEYEANDHINELLNRFPNAYFVFHSAVGLIVWWPHRELGSVAPMPLALSYMASTIYFFKQFSCDIVKDRNGMNFVTPKEVIVRQALLS